METKKYQCKKCNRPIKRKGNCLKCNLLAKRCREDILSLLMEHISKIKALDHRGIQLQIRKILENQGCLVELEKRIFAIRSGRIDVYAKRDDISIGIEIDHSTIRRKSIDKLNMLKPNAVFFVLKSQNINVRENRLRLALIKTDSFLIALRNEEIQKLRYN